MALRYFPRMLLRESSSRVRLVGNSISPGRSASGVTPIIATDGGGLWMMEYQSINLRTANHVHAFRSLATEMDGGATAIVVPMCDKRHGPFPTVDGERFYNYEPVLHDDDATFDDGSGYAQPVIVAQVQTSAALRATTLAIQFTHAGSLLGGEFFSVDHETLGWRLYEITRVNSAAGAISNVTFRPPLREATNSGTYIEFDIPRCTMQLASPDAMTLDLQTRKFGSPSVSFVEAFPPIAA